MDVKFECLECRHKFKADKESYVNCPNCGTDNVQPVSSGIAIYFILVALFIFSALAGFFGTLKLKDVISPDEPEEVVVDPEPIVEKKKSVDQETINIPTDSLPTDGVVTKIKPEIEVEAPVYDEETDKYSFRATTGNILKDTLEWTLLFVNNRDVVERNNTGIFTDILPSRDDGKYILTLNGENTEYTEQIISGFDVVKTFKKMSIEEFQDALISTGRVKLTNAESSGHVARNVKVEVLGWSATEDEINIPESLDDIRQKIKFGIWSEVNVVDVRYDSAGAINYVKITFKR